MFTLLIGLDAFDPVKFERLYNQGLAPNLGKYVESNSYARFTVSNPAQSEVSWTSIATGANPGEHGMFDFVHRNPENYQLNVSLLPTRRDRVGTQFTHPHNASTIFDQAVRQGYSATSLWWPATFPARIESPVRTLPGLGTPDILGFLGVGSAFTTDQGLTEKDLKTRVDRFKQIGKQRFSAFLKGPAKKTQSGAEESQLELTLELSDSGPARLILGKQAVELAPGKWSPILEISFRMGRFVQVHAITRAILTRVHPDPQLYFLPLQIHPLHSPWRYATPQGFVKKIWRDAGPFLTLGWPQDTTGLEEGWIDEVQFLELCDSIFSTRERVLHQQLDEFNEGLLGAVFDTLDRVQHMFWRDRQDVVEAWYKKLDSLVGRIEERVLRKGQKKPRLLIMSDHGFCDFDYKVHLNRWLAMRGYLQIDHTGNGGGKSHNLKEVNWANSQAYAVGLNSLYLNLSGREGQGCVGPDQADEVRNKLRHELLEWKDPNGQPVIHQVYDRAQVLEGPLAEYGPDLLIGYNPGYRASAETGLGGWKESPLEANHDHWGADHCVAPEKVPGVLFSNLGLENYPQPSYRDIPALAIDMAIEPSRAAPPPSNHHEDDELIEERLKGLGYL